MTSGSRLSEGNDCDNCSAICDKSTKREGRWWYECRNLTGDLTQYDVISIVWQHWWKVQVGTIQGWTPSLPLQHFGKNDYLGFLDAQQTPSTSVCIDPDAVAIDDPVFDNPEYDLDTALFMGSLECLDEPDWVFHCDTFLFYIC